MSDAEYRAEQIAAVAREMARLDLVNVVRCKDCKFGVDGGKYCAEGCADSWDWRNVEPDGFCAWGERRTNDN